MSNKEDTIPLKNPYSWFKPQDEATTPLDNYLAKCRPSMVQDDGTKPWIWATRESGPERRDDLSETLVEATAVLDATTKKVEDIQNDASIPLRASKKNGTKSKKEVREQVQTDAAEKLQEISIRRKYCNGKWLTFAGGDKVDIIWSSLAKSLINGPLSSTAAYCAKVSTCPREETPHYQHVICIYMPNVYDKDSVKEVMKVLLRHHGMNLSGVKSDLYTAIGIKSKHPSGVPSTVFKATDFIKDSEIKEMKDAFFANLKKPSTVAGSSTKAETKDKDDKKMDAKPTLKKKKQNEDPFGSASEDEGDDAPTKGKQNDSEDDDEKPRKNAKKKAATRKRSRDGSDSDDEPPPKAKRGARK
ncbi:hypothetical protein BDZ89DRAFT_1156892 [Hymenopellis radicata]|nr:hypothetical protein BDZ89DRAFT_1156892 [Hymenopellis radicata]